MLRLPQTHHSHHIIAVLLVLSLPSLCTCIPTFLHPAVPLTPPTHVHVLVCVCTAPFHFQQRQAIRNTWARQLPSPATENFIPSLLSSEMVRQMRMGKSATKSMIHGHRAPHAQAGGSSGSAGAGHVVFDFVVRFFVGEVVDGDEADGDEEMSERAILEEMRQYGDVVQLKGFEDTYAALSNKTLEMIVWAHNNSFQMVVKVDDDTYLVSSELIKSLETVAAATPNGITYSYAGVIHRDFPVISQVQSKWYMRDEYPFPTFPPYAAGPCYWLGPALLQYIAQNRNSLTRYRVEDAGVGIWLQNTHTDITDLVALMYVSTCSPLTAHSAVYINPVSHEHMVAMHSAYTNTSNICAGYRIRECEENPCMCIPSPDACQFPTHPGVKGTTWMDFMNQGYHQN
eukprot:c9318_g1_i1.p1 GENE.c9318_g1_i1~~c9318_g1_i1.p1  ORF type:complete len:399 (+),score=71.93 c9318_g1_i1:296-1492(+)